MSVSVNWLRELAPGLEGSPEELAERLTMLAVAVEAVEPVGAELADILVARVLEVRSHPDADRLTLCRVDAGGEPVDVVCGAPGVEEGALYPYVPPGATLPGGMKIERRKIRGQMSAGMLCSEHELGLGRDRGGIMRLTDQLTPGEPLAESLGLPDTRLELDLTPNRVDLACHLGVARELAPEGEAGLALKSPGPTWEPAWTDGEWKAEAAGVGVRIEDSDRCPRYLGAVIRGVRVGPSPAWLAGRLRAIGIRPVNNVVDVTNYVLHELNQPIHAFDLATLEGPEIRVRPAEPGERIRTLDGEDRVLGPEVTVIADARRPVAVAGVMGGEETEVTSQTRDVFLECAAFGPAWARKSARGLTLLTDASYRFERGIDESGLERALTRCVELILATAGGQADLAASRVGAPPQAGPLVRLRPARVEAVLGITPGPFEIRRLLTPLGFEALDAGEPGAGEPGDAKAAGGAAAPEVPEAEAAAEATEELLFRVPGWRRDVTAEIDLVEEVARRHGYDAFPDEPRRFQASVVPDDPAWARASRVRELLVGRGLLEARSSSFVGSEQVDERAAVEVLNPLSAAERWLRPALVPVLLRRLEHNFARGRRDVRLFEIGTAFERRDEAAWKAGAARNGGGSPVGGSPVGGSPVGGSREAGVSEGGGSEAGAAPGAWTLGPFHEELRVGLVLTGRRTPPHWSEGTEDADVDVWELAGLAAELAEDLCGGTLEPDPHAGQAGGVLHPGGGGARVGHEGDWLGGEAYRILKDGEPVGVAGRVRPEAVDAPPWAGTVWALELRLGAVEAVPMARFEPISAYPAVRRDLAVSVPRDVEARALESAIRAAAPEILESARLFDVYEGEGVEEGRRSLAWTFRFRSGERTLTDAEVDGAFSRIVSALEGEFDARVRAS